MNKKFKLTVTTLAENPLLEQQRAEFEKTMRNRGNGYYDTSATHAPDEWTIERVLEVTLTEAEYESVKRAVLETYK